MNKRPRRRAPRPAPEPSDLTKGDLYSLSEQETFRYGETLGRTLVGGETILLVGELGAGKTVFARGIATGLEVAPEEVGSPTFILVDKHQGRLTLYHADLYRLDREEEILDLGFEDFAVEGSVLVVEWGERLPTVLRAGALEVQITDLGDDSRKIKFRRSP